VFSDLNDPRDARKEKLMEKHNIPQLESRIKELEEVCKSVGDNSDLVELLRLLHRPGWTTPAEFTFASSIVDSMLGQARNLVALRKNLLAGSRDVELERSATA
jgi:hypothetical protein